MAELEIAVTKEEFAPFVRKAAQNLSQEVQLKGFRPGKAPLGSVVEAVGQERVLQAAIDKALPHFFVEAAVDHEVEAINRPKVAIKDLSLEGELVFTAEVDVLPEVKLGDPTKIEAETKEAKVEEEQIDKELEYLASVRAQMIEVARAAEEGDTVTVDFEIRVNGETIEGGKSENHPVELGKGMFVPEFEKGILGMQAGDTREFSMQFPKDYGQKDLAGKRAEVTATAHKVEKKVLPELNDEFAKSLGEFTGMEDLKAKLRENMEKELTQREKERYLGALAEKLTELSEFGKIPEVLIEKEVDSRLQEFAQMLAFQQQTIQQYMEREDTSLEKMREDMRETAEKRVKAGLTLRAFAKKYEIAVPEDELQEAVTKELAQFKTVEQAESEVDPQELRERVESVLKNRKTLERIAELVEGK